MNAKLLNLWIVVLLLWATVDARSSSKSKQSSEKSSKKRVKYPCDKSSQNLCGDGTCINTVGGYRCACPCGQKEIGDPPTCRDTFCDSNPCGAGECVEMEPSGYDCICPCSFTREEGEGGAVTCKRNTTCIPLGADAQSGAACTVSIRSGEAVTGVTNGQTINPGSPVSLSSTATCSGGSLTVRTSEGSTHPGCTILDNDDGNTADIGNEDVQTTGNYDLTCLNGVLYLKASSARTSRGGTGSSSVILYDVTSLGCAEYSAGGGTQSCVDAPVESGDCPVGNDFNSGTFGVSSGQTIPHEGSALVPSTGNSCEGDSIIIRYGTAPFAGQVVIDDDGSGNTQASNEDVQGRAPGYTLTCEHGVLMANVPSGATKGTNTGPDGTPGMSLYGVTSLGCGHY